MSEKLPTRTIEGKVVQKIGFEEFNKYDLGGLSDQDEFQIVRVECDGEPDSRFWSFVLDYIPEWLAEYKEVYAVLVRDLDRFEDNEFVRLKVAPSFYSANVMRLRGTAPLGKPVRVVEELEVQ